MTAPRLQVIRCEGCQAPVPLPRNEGARAACAFCGAATAVPATHLEALAALARTEAARRAAEPRWRRLAAPPPAWVARTGLVLVVVLPVIATLVASLVPEVPPGIARVHALATLPALLPGAVITLWALAVAATSAPVRDAMRARPPERSGGPPGCRHCGAPLALEPEAIAASCGYCGADNLVEEVPVAAVRARLRDALGSLGEANARLRLQRIVLGLGLAGLAVLVGGAAALLWRAATMA